MLFNSPFDALASNYDSDFTHTLSGKLQRNRVWYFLDKLIADRKLNVLELNCGTGEDAFIFAQKGHTILATDVSEKMIQICNRKLSDSKYTSVSFAQIGFSNLSQQLKGKKFDFIFSNFAGLNCASHEEMANLNTQLYQMLNDKGKLVIVSFGKKCLSEQLYFLWKGDKQSAFRRRKCTAHVAIANDVWQTVYYYTIRQWKQEFNNFNLVSAYPIGLFILPSYLEHLMQKSSLLRRMLSMLENLFGSWSIASSYADHTMMVFEKKIKSPSGK